MRPGDVLVSMITFHADDDDVESFTPVTTHFDAAPFNEIMAAIDDDAADTASPFSSTGDDFHVRLVFERYPESSIERGEFVAGMDLL